MIVTRILAFAAALIFGVEAASFVRYKTVSLDEELERVRNHPVRNIYNRGGGSGSSGSSETTNIKPLEIRGANVPLQILSKPKALYTDAARENGTQGIVRLKITLLASGSIGAITPITRLPNGLTEQAIAAARQISFRPKMVNGSPVSVIVTFDYGFTIY